MEYIYYGVALVVVGVFVALIFAGKERREYETLKAKEKKRRHKALSKKRAAASRHGKKKHK